MNSKMQVASVSTARESVRSDIHGWTFDDASLLVRKARPEEAHKIFIGYTPGPKHIPYYGTVLEMLADGWKLLAPPIERAWSDNSGERFTEYDWWLTREQGEGL